MDLMKSFKLELSQKEVEQLIKEACEREIGRTVVSVDISINPGYDDRFESSPAGISKVTVKLGEEIRKKQTYQTAIPDDIRRWNENC